MALRPTPAALDAFRTLCRRPLLRGCSGAPALPKFRGLSTSTTRGAWWSKDAPKAEQQPPNAVPATPIAVGGNEASGPITPFQEKIAALETAALDARSSADPKEQITLLTALRDGDELGGLITYYEAIAFTGPPDGSDALMKSDEAFHLYTSALASTGRLAELATAVRRRDQRLSELGVSPSSSETAASASAPSSSSTASAPAATTPSSAAPSTPYASLLSGNSAATQAPAQAAAPAAAATGAAASSAPQHGSPLHPIYVQLAPQTTANSAWRVTRWLIGLLLWGFLILTVLSMVMENTGLLKAGPGPAEFEPEEGKAVKFSDVHGVEEAKGELEEIVEFLRNPDKFNQLGGKLPKGVLLTGPPGTGKTMLARAVAGEAEVPFLFASGSSFDEMFVGVGAKRVRELFAAARKKAPAIVFIDELDAIGSKRSAKDQHYMKQTLNQLLVELDGFEQSEGVIIIAATNFPESLDKALTRPGRFDRHVVVGLPDVRGRIAILKHHMSNISIAKDVDPAIIARGCPGMSGADLANLVNQAAVKASRDGAREVDLDHFEWAKDRILMGAERRSHYVTDASKRATAYHEGGHALAALHTPGAVPLHKVTIMPRGQALGLTFQLPEQDKDSYTRKEYQAMIDVALGGRAAEEMLYGYDDVTSGCSSDLQRATDVAANMIRSFGFSDKIGLVAHGDQESLYLSGKKKDEIESEIRSFLDKGMTRVTALLKKHEDELHNIANALIEYETLSLDEVKEVLAGRKLNRVSTKGQALRSKSELEAEKDDK